MPRPEPEIVSDVVAQLLEDLGEVVAGPHGSLLPIVDRQELIQRISDVLAPLRIKAVMESKRVAG